MLRTVTISAVRTRDVRFQLPGGEGTDAVHSDGMYGPCVILALRCSHGVRFGLWWWIIRYRCGTLDTDVLIRSRGWRNELCPLRL